MADYVISTKITMEDNFSSAMVKVGKRLDETSNKVSNFKNNLQKSDFSSKFNSGMDNIVNKSKITKSTLTSLGKSFVTFGKIAGASLVAAGLTGLKLGSDMEGLSAQMTTAFAGNKKAAAEYFAWANKFANATPFSNEEVIASTVKLKMQGADPKKVLGNIGDMAGAMGKPLEQATEAFLDASRGELERLKEFGITKDMIIKEGEKIGVKDIFDSKGSLNDVNKLMTALNSLMQSKFKGGMDNLANTLKGRLSTTIGTLQYNVAQVFGVMEDGSIRAGSAIEKVNQMLEKLNSYLESAEGKKKVEEFSKALDDLVSKFSVDTMVEGFKKIGTSLDDIIEKATRFAGLMAGFRIGATVGAVAGPQGAAIGGIAGAALGYALPGINIPVKSQEEVNAQKTAEIRQQKIDSGATTNTTNTNKVININITGKNEFRVDQDTRSFAKKLSDLINASN